jgi:hypothetical protein
VSGMLLYEKGSFFQVLEGGAVDVHNVYSRIRQDPRHGRVMVLNEREIPKREFAEWSMGFVTLGDRRRELPGFIDFFQSATAEDAGRKQGAAQLMLQAFREGRFRSAIR